MTNIAILFSSFANRYPHTQFVTWQTLANLTNMLALNMDTCTMIMSLLVVVPFCWDNFPWDTRQDVYERLIDLLIHVFPFITEAINFFYLSNTTGYFIDSWLMLAVTLIYLAWSIIWKGYAG